VVDNEGMLVLVEDTDTLVALPHKLWTREQCAVLEGTGVLDPERYELIEGELILKMGKNQPHMAVQALFLSWLQSNFGPLFALQDPTIDLHPAENSTNEPQPDAVVLDRSIRTISGRPTPERVRLVGEISDTSLSFDLKVKARLYARAGIAEYWVVDLKGRRVIVHRRPEGGQYLDVVAYSSDEMVETLGAPGVAIRVGDLF